MININLVLYKYFASRPKLQHKSVLTGEDDYIIWNAGKYIKEI